MVPFLEGVAIQRPDDVFGVVRGAEGVARIEFGVVLWFS